MWVVGCGLDEEEREGERDERGMDVELQQLQSGPNCRASCSPGVVNCEEGTCV